MIYLWVKAAHVVAMVTWVGGMLLEAMTLASLRAAGPALPLRFIASIRVWDRQVTSPAMLLTWALGLALATWGGWFVSGWLMLKLVVVAALSALHGVQVGTLRRIAADRPGSMLSGRAAAVAVLAGLATIVALVVVKPF